MAFPYRLTRAGVVMTPDPADPREAEGVLNPASGQGPDGLVLFPRLVAAGNVSRVGRARVILDDGMPVGVERDGIALEPERAFESGVGHSGVEDPRITRIDALGIWAMTYVAYGPLGPRTALAVSRDLRDWRRLGPVTFGYDDSLGIDLNLFPNKDTLFFPEPVTGPDGVESLAVLHRPMWDLDEIAPGQGAYPPKGLDARQSIWIAFVRLDDARREVSALTHWTGSRLVAAPAHPFEAVKIGGGPPPVRVPEGWLLLHHGVTGVLEREFSQQQNVNYAAGGMILDAERPWEVRERTAEPLLQAETEEERSGIVPNVVFPTAIEEVAGVRWMFYGMADSKIGVARLDRAA
ncbi:MAG TPA: glycosidase [Pseudolysinimonas sp.]|nr:glycosidase [Pseudolysinimonas sp.]